MLRNWAAERFNAIRLLEGDTLSVRVVEGKLRLFLTSEDGRETSRPISKEVAEEYWKRRRHFSVLDAIAEMRAELGKG